MKISLRKKLLWGLTTPHAKLRMNYGLRVLLFPLMILPAIVIGWGITETLIYGYEGDPVSTDMRVILACAAFFLLGTVLTRMIANRLILQYIIHKRQKYEKVHSPVIDPSRHASS